jgi:hypothetical protein
MRDASNEKWRIENGKWKTTEHEWKSDVSFTKEERKRRVSAFVDSIKSNCVFGHTFGASPQAAPLH